MRLIITATSTKHAKVELVSNEDGTWQWVSFRDRYNIGPEFSRKSGAIDWLLIGSGNYKISGKEVK